MRIATLRRLTELIDDMLRRRLVRIAHAKIDDVLATRSRFRLELIDDGKNVRGQALDALELIVRLHGGPAAEFRRNKVRKSIRFEAKIPCSGLESNPMQLNLENLHNPLRIQRYDRGEIQLADVTYRNSLLLLPDRARPEDWAFVDISELRPEDCALFLEQRPEIVLLGSGAAHQFPSNDVLRFFQQHRIGLEVMETGAACRTWNVLLNEERAVCAGILINNSER
jgi:uncharacterized protein